MLLLVYVLFVGVDGTTKCHFLCMKDVAYATVPDIKALLENAFAELGVEDWRWRL